MYATRITAACAAGLLIAWAPLMALSPVNAADVDFGLNVMYLDPSDDQSGGVWHLMVRTDAAYEGLAGASVRLLDVQDIEFRAPQGDDNGQIVGFSLERMNETDHTEIVLGMVQQDPTRPEFIQQSLFYDVGEIGGGQQPGDNGTPTFDLSTSRNIPWGSGDPLGDAAWSGAALLAVGSFGAGTTPSFFSDGNETTKANVWATVGDEVNPGDAIGEPDGITFDTIVRDNLGLLSGDYNRDGTVNAPDYNVWRDNFGSTNELAADGNNDLVINAPDYNVWRDNFGNTLGAASGQGAAVPEPSTAVLVLFGAVFLAIRKNFC